MDHSFDCSDSSISDIQELEHRLTAVFGASGFDVSERANLKVRSKFIQLHELALGFFTFSTLARIKFAERDIAALGLTLAGNGIVTAGKRAAISAVHSPTLTSPGQASEFHYGANQEKLFVRFKASALKRKLSTLIGAPVNRAVRFELADFTSRDMLFGLSGLVETLQNQVARRFLLSPLALRELEEAVIVQLLFTGRHALTAQLQRKPPLTSADVIGRVEQFIEANWHRPLEMEALSEVGGVSPRALYRTFVKIRGYSPMVFARKIRLERANALLSQPDATTSVTGVAFKCGFSNLGRFAHDYRSTFGELPSETLSRSYAIAPQGEN